MTGLNDMERSIFAAAFALEIQRWDIFKCERGIGEASWDAWKATTRTLAVEAGNWAVEQWRIVAEEQREESSNLGEGDDRSPS